ncbi:MAG: 50S ribosome-binding GTPase [Planctomycetes bacterium]|nr:50S ribosome-binding GTPase [Planctomycetota bacterium]
MEPTLCAGASATGGLLSIIRLSGPAAMTIAEVSGLSPGQSWRSEPRSWQISGGACPCRVFTARAPRSYTGCDLIEITLPGSRDVVALALEALVAAGAEHATRGAFTRQALAHGRLTLVQAEAILAVTSAPDAEAAERAIAVLRGSWSRDLTDARERVLRLRALVEANLDFLDEADVTTYGTESLRCECASLRDLIRGWMVAAGSIEGLPMVCLAGPANAGKSALFARLTGERPLVSPIPGTTRDALECVCRIGGRDVRVVDTAGWLEDHPDADPLDRASAASARRIAADASLILICSAADAPAPEVIPLNLERAVIIATKSDLGSTDARAELAVCALTGAGIGGLESLIAGRLAHASAGDARQQRLLGRAEAILARLASRIGPDEVLAEDLRQVSEALGELMGATTPDDVLEAIFSRFCIGK